MYVLDFNYHRPQTLEEACKILGQSKNAALIAGGTDVLVEIKKGLRHNDDIVSLADLQELKTIVEDKNNIYIGAGVTHNEIIRSGITIKNLPALVEAASMIGTEQIRNTATIGGNLCTGASCCDMAPVLIALNADVEVTNSTEKRTVSLKDFFIFHKETSLNNVEIMTSIIVTKPVKNTGVSFEKFGLREAASISVASASAFVKTDCGVCIESCVVIGAVAPTPKISEKASAILNSTRINALLVDSTILKEIGKAASDDSLPLDDIRATADYRRNIVNILAQHSVLKAARRAID